MRPYFGRAHLDEDALTWLQCEVMWYILLLIVEVPRARNAIRA